MQIEYKGMQIPFVNLCYKMTIMILEAVQKWQAERKKMAV